MKSPVNFSKSIGKIWVLAFLLTAFFGSAIIGQDIKAPTKPVKKRLPLGVMENIKYCDGSKIKDKYRNPVCTGWTFVYDSNSGSPEAMTLLADHPKFCEQKSDVICYWFTARSACKAYKNMKEKLFTDQSLKPFVEKHKEIDAFEWKCSYGFKGDSLGSDGYYALQTSATKVTIPPQHYFSYCNIEFNGPYSNFADEYTLCNTTQTQTYPGMIFTLSQANRVRQINRAKHNGQIKSDLAGFCYKKPSNATCTIPHPTQRGFCVEPEVLQTRNPGEKDAAQVHHVIPRTDTRNCPCGKNSFKNAAVISKQLNSVFSNQDRQTFSCNGKTELEWLEAVEKY